MLFFLISFVPFLLLLSKPLSLKSLFPPWANELRLVFILLCQESVLHFVDWLRTCWLVRIQVFKIPSTVAPREKQGFVTENAAEGDEPTVLDLPELPLELILVKLSPAGLCSMAGVCKSLRDRCRSDHLWERHLREKWGRVLGRAARREWELYVASRMRSSSHSMECAKPKGWIGTLACACPLSWLNSKLDNGSKPSSSQPVDSIMDCYLDLQSGKFWFPAQVYNRENGNAGFMLSCYDAELSYDCDTDTFHARYLPHRRWPKSIEEGVRWDRLRAPPVDTPASELHVSDCLNDLHPGDHIEIQWRKNKEFPFGWWYGVVGHMESCGNERDCYCHSCDTIILEFKHYTPGSKWRRTTINRKDHREEGNETDGFYGGIRKLHNKDQISTWRRMWPADVLE